MSEAPNRLGNEPSHFQKLIENIDDTVTVVDADGTQIWTSAAENSDLGYDSDFWRTADLFSLVHPDDLPSITKNYEQVLQTADAMASGEVRLQAPDGSYRYVGYVARNLLSDAEIGGIVITSRSIDEEVRARLERDERQRRLEEALADRGKFIAQLSHEMRSPLHAMQGLAEVLQGSPDLVETDRKHVASIVGVAGALRRMLDDLLDMSKVNSGHMELDVRAFSPAKVCDGIGSTHRPTALEKGLDLNVVIDRSVPRVVLGDEHRLRQILVNLVSNAIKYTDEGKVELRLGPGDGRYLRFEVADTGRGIPAEKLATLFDPYQQVRVEDAQVGTGIGLTITKDLTELMGGTIAVESSEAGSNFTCLLPFKEGRRPTDRQPVGTSLTRVSEQETEILVVDDSEVNRTLATAQLERLGFRALVVSSGDEAIELITRRAVDLVFMDWHMPDLDGLETTRQLRALGDAIAQPRIVAMTASVMSGDREQCLDAGMDDYLAKPVAIADLEQMISRWTASSSQASAATSALDHNALDSLIEDLGDADVARSVVLSFLGEMKKWRAEISAGVDTSDLVAARRTAHTVKSTAALLGAMPLAEACAAFESDATTDSAAGELLESVLTHADKAEHDLLAQVAAWDSQTNSNPDSDTGSDELNRQEATR